MTEPDDEFDLDAFNAAFAKEFGEPLPAEPEGERAEDAPPTDDPAEGSPAEGDPADGESAGARKSLIAMVLTPVADATVLAKLMGLVKITWPVLATRTGAIAATTFDIDGMAGLTGSTPDEATKVAEALSRTSEFGVVLLTSQVGQGSDGATGQIQAARFVGGERVETLSPGVVLAGVDATVEKVLFGQVPPQDATGALDPLEVAKREEPTSQPKRRWGRKPR